MEHRQNVTVREDERNVKVCPKAETAVCFNVHSKGIEASMIYCTSNYTFTSDSYMQRKAVTLSV